MLRLCFLSMISVVIVSQVVHAQSSENSVTPGFLTSQVLKETKHTMRLSNSVDHTNSELEPGFVMPETNEYLFDDNQEIFEKHSERKERFFRLAEVNIYPTFSYRDELSATYNEFEFTSYTHLGPIEMENRTILNVADLPSGIVVGPTNFGDEPTTVGTRASGFGDVLSGFFFSRRVEDRNWHLGVGPVFTFPSAVSPILGNSKYTVGPGVHFSAEWEKLTAGFFLWQSWSFAGDPAAKEVNSLFGKPFFIYELSDKWHLVYIPLGLSYSWESPGSKTTIPIGGGIRRLFQVGEHQIGFQAQAFDYVARKSSDPEWELRFTIEFLIN